MINYELRPLPCTERLDHSIFATHRRAHSPTRKSIIHFRGRSSIVTAQICAASKVRRIENPRRPLPFKLHSPPPAARHI
ncbi:hypothetical protein A0H81_00923 [Grifola frondosa]|uniref:Uncharacterized protein n=1 Tax=Grifola frondosa TaxID=5627 RepID=A0A1C7MQL2_GRIFR|nr:hypothetical protein A0H81_00923 [Grifola frondosa]